MQPTGPKEVFDTIVPKTTVEERLKFVDLDFVQDVEKFVEVPEVFYNDTIVEVSAKRREASRLISCHMPLCVNVVALLFAADAALDPESN